MFKKTNNLFDYYYAILLAASTIGLIFPYGFPLIYLLIFIFFIHSLINKKISIKLNIGVILLFLLILFHYLGFLMTYENMNMIVRTDSIGTILIIMLTLLNGNSHRYSLVNIRNMFFVYLTIFIPPLAALSLYKYYSYNKGIMIDLFVFEGKTYPWGTSLMSDYNMFALGMLTGVIGIFWTMVKSKSKFVKIYCLLSLPFIMYSIYLSGSRRGLVVLGIVIIYIGIISVIKLYKNSVKNNLLVVAFSMLILLIFLNTNFLSNTIIQGQDIQAHQNRYDTLNNIDGAFSSRGVRWSYAAELINEFKIHNYILGSGFDYIESYGNKFNTINRVDYPHNIFISAFLYSGIIGVTTLVLFLLLPLVRFIKYRAFFPFEIVFIYVINLLFLIVSGNSFFSIHILWILTTLITSINFKRSK